MESKEQANQSVSIMWRALFVANLILGIIYWFGLSTDYKLKDSRADIGFAWLVGIVALISWILVAASTLSRSRKTLFSYFVAPSVVGSTPYLFLSILFIGLSSAFGPPILVDKIESPDHSKVIEIHYFPGFDCGHSYVVSLNYYAFPFLRREIIQLLYIPNDVPLCSYESGTMEGSIDTGIDWINNDEIIVPYGNSGMKAIYVGLVRFNWPVSHIRFFVGYVSLLMIIHGFQRFRKKQQNEYT